MKHLFTLALTASFLILLSACSSNEAKLEDLGLANMAAKEILAGLADGTIEPDGYAISVYDDRLVVIIDDDTIEIDMPEDEFYVSVAPYMQLTHECTFHSATGCRGELKNETFFVEFVLSDGTVVFAEEIDTMSNGFMDLWLPRDVEGTLTITQGEYTTSKVLTTTSGQPTCETTMRLLQTEETT